jgi:hypothetical protein
VAEPREFGCCAQVILLRSGREGNVDDLFDPSRAGGHDGDALTEVDRLVDAMGDEDDGLP